MMYLCLGMPLQERAKGEQTYQRCISSISQFALHQRFMFVEFRNVDDAEIALGTMHNHPFDAKHTFKANRFTDIERYADLDETYVEPELEEYTPRVRLLYVYCVDELSKLINFRSISGHGWLTHKDAINMLLTEVMRC